MEHERKSFLFYASYLDAVEKLKDKNAKLELLLAIAHYGLDRHQPHFNNELANMAWVFIEPLLDANYQNYVNGCKGGAPSESMKGNQNAKKDKNKPKTNPKQTDKEPKTNENKSNDNDNDNVNDNYKDNANDNDNENENVNVNINKEKDIEKEKNPYVDISIDGEPFITDLKKYNEWIAEHGDPEEEEGA